MCSEQKTSNVRGCVNAFKLKAVGIMHQYNLCSVLTLRFLSDNKDTSRYAIAVNCTELPMYFQPVNCLCFIQLESKYLIVN
jgi:hypothetical protein